MLKYVQVSHDFSDSQLYNKFVKLEEKKLVTEIYQPFYLLLIRIDLL